MTVQALETESTQSHDETSRSPLASFIMLVSLGLMPHLVDVTGPVVTYSTASESTYTVPATTASMEFEWVTDALFRIHNTLLSEAKELDAAARQVLNQHLWDLYVS